MRCAPLRSRTPITPLAIDRFRAKGPPDGEGRISLGQDPTVGLQYAGELIAAFIGRAGGSVKGKISIGTVTEGLEPITVHRQSRTLSEILAEMLRDFEQLRRQSSLPRDRRTPTGRAGQPREVA